MGFHTFTASVQSFCSIRSPMRTVRRPSPRLIVPIPTNGRSNIAIPATSRSTPSSSRSVKPLDTTPYSKSELNTGSPLMDGENSPRTSNEGAVAGSTKEINDATPAASPSFRTRGFYRDSALSRSPRSGVHRRRRLERDIARRQTTIDDFAVQCARRGIHASTPLEVKFASSTRSTRLTGAPQRNVAEQHTNTSQSKQPGAMQHYGRPKNAFKNRHICRDGGAFNVLSLYTAILVAICQQAGHEVLRGLFRRCGHGRRACRWCEYVLRDL
jgi:hypothetical protein